MKQRTLGEVAKILSGVSLVIAIVAWLKTCVGAGPFIVLSIPLFLGAATPGLLLLWGYIRISGNRLSRTMIYVVWVSSIGVNIITYLCIRGLPKEATHSNVWFPETFVYVPIPMIILSIVGLSLPKNNRSIQI